MNYLSVSQTAEKWGISTRRIQHYDLRGIIKRLTCAEKGERIRLFKT